MSFDLAIAQPIAIPTQQLRRQAKFNRINNLKLEEKSSKSQALETKPFGDDPGHSLRYGSLKPRGETIGKHGIFQSAAGNGEWLDAAALEQQ